MEGQTDKKTEFHPEPAESFEIDYLSASGVEIQDAMSQMGFSFRRSGVGEDGNVYFEGEKGDGTKIRIMIKKGENYKSPAEIEGEEKEK